MGPQAAPYPGAQSAQSVTMGPQAAPYPGARRHHLLPQRGFFLSPSIWLMQVVLMTSLP
jgi:hypothetical protein